MYVINLWGAPSSGKTTTACGLMYLMKLNRFRVELVREYAKELIYEKQFDVLKNEQNRIFAEQNRRQAMLVDNIDYTITESPLPLSAFYQPPNYLPTFKKQVWEQFKDYKNINFFLNRVTDFETFGRVHDEAKSVMLSHDMKEFLRDNGVKFQEFDATPQTANLLIRVIRDQTAPNMPPLRLLLGQEGDHGLSVV